MRTNYCGLVTAEYLDQTITLCGWVHRRRDHGGVIFIDLRDREGLVQVVCDPDRAEVFAIAESIRNEYVVSITGKVRRRPSGTENAALTSGQIEVLCHELEVLNVSATPPFQLDDENLSETTRLTHRVIDLRRPQMQKNMMLRYKTAMAFRRFLDAKGFIDIETPMLTKSTPEGARDYLVPSRVHPGHFFALPQSPQLFKQLLMVAGYDRYYQITKCFRDEDLRADRQPEFTQVDIETSFLGEAEITALMEEMIRSIFKEVLDVDLPDPFPRMTYAEAMSRFGSDKPDLRVTLEITDVTDAVRDVAFKVFSGPANSESGRVAAIRVPGGAQLTRGEIDEYTRFVGIYGARGLAYIKVNDITKLSEEGLQSPIVKNLHQQALALSLGDHLLLGEGEQKSGGHRRPSILADALEALFGAVWLDGGFDAASEVILRLYQGMLLELAPGQKIKDAKTRLQEYLQGRRLALPQYALINTEGEAHAQHFTVTCTIEALRIRSEGSGSTRRAAEQVAAERALDGMASG